MTGLFSRGYHVLSVILYASCTVSFAMLLLSHALMFPQIYSLIHIAAPPELPFGWGRHVYDLPLDIDHEAPIKILFGIQQTYLWSWFFVKMAMCFFLLRVFVSLRIPIYA